MENNRAVDDACGAEGCGFPLHEIDGQVLIKAIETIRPSLKSPSLPASVRAGGKPSARRQYVICPRCDAYGLGMELETAFQIQSASGKLTDVHELAGLIAGSD